MNRETAMQLPHPALDKLESFLHGQQPPSDRELMTELELYFGSLRDRYGENFSRIELRIAGDYNV